MTPSEIVVADTLLRLVDRPANTIISVSFIQFISVDFDLGDKKEKKQKQNVYSSIGSREG